MRPWVLLVPLLAGCVPLQSRIDLEDGRRIYVGMTGEQITNLLGPPDHIGAGIHPGDRPYAASILGNYLIVPGAATIEWAWNRENEVLVAWLEHGSVRFLASVPRKEASDATATPETRTPLPTH